MQDQLNHLCRLTERHAGYPERVASLPRLGLFVSHGKTCATSTLYRPMICLVLQGAKEVTIGSHMLRYDPARGGYIVDVTRDQLKDAPAMQLDQTERPCEVERQVYSYWDSTPYW